jgi:hypothetical protein
MWVRGQGRSIVNFDYVTQVEARVQEAAYSTSNSEPKYEVIAYRRPPANDAILLNMLDARTATAVVDRLGGAIMAEALLVDVMDLLEQVRYETRKPVAVEQVATVDAQTIVEAAARATPDQEEALITPT